MYIDIQGCTMVSKCANPACSEQFRYLHEGKLFHLTPTPEIQASEDGELPFLYERFWLCDACAKKMTLVWGGTGAKLVPLPEKPLKLTAVDSGRVVRRRPLKRRAVHAGRESE